MKQRKKRITIYVAVLLLALGASLPGVIDESNRIVFIILTSIFLAAWAGVIAYNEIRIYQRNKNERD